MRTTIRGTLTGRAALIGLRRFLGVAVVGATALMATAERALAQSGSGDRVTTAEGVFTEQQARRGEEVFNNVCANCHPSSRFEGSSFLPSWEGAPVSTLYTVIRTQMPFDNPGSLDPEEYAAVLAYIFDLNGFPASKEPLPASTDSLQRMQIQIQATSGS